MTTLLCRTCGARFDYSGRQVRLGMDVIENCEVLGAKMEAGTLRRGDAIDCPKVWRAVERYEADPVRPGLVPVPAR